MVDIFIYSERQEKMKEIEKKMKEIEKKMKGREKRVDDINKLFSGGAKPSVSAAKRFASSGNSPLHAKGSFEDAKKRFGKFD